jgi:hypothetical protein
MVTACPDGVREDDEGVTPRMKTQIEKLKSRWRWLAVAAIAGLCSTLLVGCGSSAPPKVPQEKVKAIEAQLDPSQIKTKGAKGLVQRRVTLA